MSYTDQDLLQAYRDVGLVSGDTVYVMGALWRFTDYQIRDMDAIVRAHFSALREAVGETGTIVVASSSFNLCNTDIVFDLETTPSFNVGVLSEFVRTHPEAKRSFHPFGSYAAVGARADEITRNVSRHVYGIGSPEGRLIDMKAKTVCVGLPVNICSTVHHVEQMMAVPYRYVKEFNHPVLRNGTVEREHFYMHVRYLDSDIERSHNKRLFSIISNDLGVASTKLSRSHINAYGMADFFRLASEVFLQDIYVWCEFPPTQRPWVR